MSEPNKTVFISYRRDSSDFTARAIFLELKSNDFDVFMDVDSIGAGNFKDIILSEIERRRHFLVILTKDSLKDLKQEGDWLRLEIEQALKCGCNFVPIFTKGFKWNPRTRDMLPENLRKLDEHNGIEIRNESFDADMQRLRTKFLYQVDGKKARRFLSEIHEATIQLGGQKVTIKLPTQADFQAELYLRQGNEKVAQKDDIGAIEEFTKAIRVKPDYYAAYNNRSNAFRRLGKYDEGLKDCNQAIRLRPDLAHAFINRGAIYSELKSYDIARADFDKAILLRPDLAEAFYNRGLMYEELKDYEVALADYNRALELNPDYASAFNGRGNIYFNFKDYEAALSDYNRALELNPDHVDAFFHRGVVHMKFNDDDAALADFNQALQLKPDYANALYSRGSLYKGLGNLQQALADFEKAYQFDPDNDNLNARGYIYFALGRFEEALTDFKEVYRLDPEYQYILPNLAITHHALGNRDEARRIWRELRAKDPRFMDAEWLQEEWNWLEAHIAEARLIMASLDEGE